MYPKHPQIPTNPHQLAALARSLVWGSRRVAWSVVALAVAVSELGTNDLAVRNRDVRVFRTRR